jgi:hypothetical protein
MSDSEIAKFKREFPDIKGFMKDTGLETKDRRVQEELGKLVIAIKKSPVGIPYEWFVEQMRDETLSVANIKKLATKLENRYTDLKDEQLSGSGGHMFGKHVMVDREDQEARMDEEGKPRVTRIVNEGKNIQKYNAYVKKMKEEVPIVVRSFFEAVLDDLLTDIQDPGFAGSYTNNRARKVRLEAVIAERPTEFDEDGFTIEYDWTVAVTGNWEAKITCSPTVTSEGVFQKIVTEIEPRSGKKIETQEVDHVKSFAGRNKLVLSPLTAATTGPQLDQLINGLDFDKLGITQY